jgi:hypothetical protein
MVHSWSPQEELFVLHPLATDDNAKTNYLSGKKAYRSDVAKDVNRIFGGYPGYVDLDVEK